MNDQLQKFARDTLKAGLSKCTEEQQEMFKRMHGYTMIARPINEVVDAMPPKALDWAMQQVQRTLDRKKNKMKEIEMNQLEAAKIDIRKWRKIANAKTIEEMHAIRQGKHCNFCLVHIGCSPCALKGIVSPHDGRSYGCCSGNYSKFMENLYACRIAQARLHAGLIRDMIQRFIEKEGPMAHDKQFKDDVNDLLSSAVGMKVIEFEIPKKGQLFWDRYKRCVREAHEDLIEKFLIMEEE